MTPRQLTGLVEVRNRTTPLRSLVHTLALVLGREGLFLLCLIQFCNLGVAQQAASAQGSSQYSLRVTVNEVGITFHAADSNNHPITNLRPEEIDLFDNEKGPGQIVSMQLLPDRSIHAAFVIDTSGSVAAQVTRSRTEASEAAQKLLTQVQDEGSVIIFGRTRRVLHSWTHEVKDLLGSVQQVPSSHDPIDGTAVYDALFSTCHYEFGSGDTRTSANVVLLFSDGDDNKSYMTLQAAADACRNNHVAIYAFSPTPTPGTTSTGPANLRQLTELTGGRLFYDDDPEGDVHADIATVGSDLRDEYLLVYRPKNIVHNGAFHSIVLVGPKRVDKIVGTTGFYAPAH